MSEWEKKNRARQRGKLDYNAVSRNISVYPIRKLGGSFRVITSLGERAGSLYFLKC